MTLPPLSTFLRNKSTLKSKTSALRISPRRLSHNAGRFHGRPSCERTFAKTRYASMEGGGGRRRDLGGRDGYEGWSREDLIVRLRMLEGEGEMRFGGSTFSSTNPTSSTNTTLPIPPPARITSPPLPPPPSISHDQPASKSGLQTKPTALRSFNPDNYTTRHIALKFAYLGATYNGFEHHTGNSTPLPTIEEELWKALVKCRLISPPSLGQALRSRGNEEAVREEDRQEGGDGEGGISLDLWSKKGREGLDGLGYVPVDWEGCGYSKCGRTDKGVSAFGQVIGVRVRSLRPMRSDEIEGVGNDKDAHIASADHVSDVPVESSESVDTAPAREDRFWDDVKDELAYISLLNKVLPQTIRALAWCPHVPSNFDARFSCKERQYKYFFTSPAFLPVPGSSGTDGAGRRDGYLDIEAMREAASYLVGSHDFRNFCRADPSKQITNFTRRVTLARIDEVSAAESPTFVGHPALTRSSPSNGSSHSEDSDRPMKTFAFVVQGSAFLWHQVRCMAGLLFLVGQGLESPSLIKTLLDVEKYPCRPKYEMACDTPLVLWDCMFSIDPAKGRFEIGEKPDGHVDRGRGPDELEWIYAAHEQDGGKAKWEVLMEQLWTTWRKAKMEEVLASQLMDLAAFQGSSLDSFASSSPASSSHDLPSGPLGLRATAGRKSTRVFEGADTAVSRGKYVPVMKKERMDTISVINARYLAKKVARSKARSANETGG